MDRRTETAKKVDELAIREALALGHNYIGTEHILLALTRVDGIVGRALKLLGVNRANAMDAITEAGKEPSHCATCVCKIRDGSTRE